MEPTLFAAILGHYLGLLWSDRQSRASKRSVAQEMSQVNQLPDIMPTMKAKSGIPFEQEGVSKTYLKVPSDSGVWSPTPAG